MIATTKEQGQRLLDCGADPRSADMMHSPYGGLSTNSYSEKLCDRNYTPAWSLSALLELLPKQLHDFPFSKCYSPFLDGEWCDMGAEVEIDGDLKLYSDGKK